MPTKARGIHSHPRLKKGLRDKVNKPSVKFADILVSTVIPAYPMVDDVLGQLKTIQFGMDGNGPDDRFGPDFPGAGDCVDAMADHGTQVIDQILTGSNKPWSVAALKTFYASQNEKFTWDTDKKTGSGSAEDGGMDIQLSLEWLTKHGFDTDGNLVPVSKTVPPVILGFAEVDFTNEAEFNAAIYYGLALWTGVELQQIQMSQFNQNKDWDFVASSPDDGGHGIPQVWYGNEKPLCVTWAQLKEQTENFVIHAMTQCFFVITQAHVDHAGFRAGISLETFASLYKGLTGKPFPVPVTPTPGPVTPPVNPPAPGPVLSISISDHALIAVLVKQGGNSVNALVTKELKALHHLK